MEKQTILIVDDESRMRKLVSDFLTKNGYDIMEASNGSEALKIFQNNKEKISLIILDVMMPFMNGWDASEAIRKDSNVPIILLTAKESEQDQLKGYSLKIDDYITKPFSPKILVARVDALLRRTSTNESDDIIKEGILTIDSRSRNVKVNDELIELSFKEFELLKYFAKNKGYALSREKILNAVWDYDYFGDARTVDTHIKKLRQKLGEAGEYIKTVWGMGYKFEV